MLVLNMFFFFYSVYCEMGIRSILIASPETKYSNINVCFLYTYQFSNHVNTISNTRGTRCCGKVCYNMQTCVRHALNLSSHIYVLIQIFSCNSTRVSNELGAGNPRSARMAAFTALFVAVLESVTVSAIVFSSRHVFGYVFSNDKEVVDYVANMAPLLSVSVILDSLQVVLSGSSFFSIFLIFNLSVF